MKFIIPIIRHGSYGSQFCDVEYTKACALKYYSISYIPLFFFSEKYMNVLILFPGKQNITPTLYSFVANNTRDKSNWPKEYIARSWASHLDFNFLVNQLLVLSFFCHFFFITLSLVKKSSESMLYSNTIDLDLWGNNYDLS